MSLRSLCVLRTAMSQAARLVNSQCLQCQARALPQPISVRTLCKFRRLHQPKKAPKDLPLLERDELFQKYYIYSLEDCDVTRPQGDMQVILKYDIEGVGMKGEIVTVTKRLARYTLLPAGVAMYVSPENLAENEKVLKELGERPAKSIWAQKTIRQLKGMHLPIPMNPKASWTLNKTHVKVAFRNVGVELSEDCIELPAEPVRKYGPVTITVMVNGEDRAPVTGTIYEYTLDERNRPTQPLWNHTDVTVDEIVIDVMKKNNLIENATINS